MTSTAVNSPPAGPARPEPARTGSMYWLLAAACGVLSAAVGLGIGELVAAFFRPEASPIVVVANRFILATPEWLKQRAIAQFGTDDKLALGVGIFIVIGLFAAVVGVVGLFRRRIATLALVGFGGVGVYCALTTHAHRGSDVVPVVLAAAVAAATLDVLLRLLRTTAQRTASVQVRGAARRSFLTAGVSSVALAALSGFGGRRWQHRRFDAARSRAQVVLPSPVAPPPPAPAPPADPLPSPSPSGAQLAKNPLPFATPNKSFYRIDTAYSVPQVDADTWKLRIHGMVDTPVTYTLADLLAMPLIERWITMMCVSYEVGGDLIGNARFRGVALAPLLRKAGVDPGANQLVCRSVDGMTIGAPTQQVMDGRDAMLAVGMNGTVLPIEHGFPVRMVVPGLYGYVSACKWITDIEATTFAAYDAYWVQRGWLAQLPITLGSRIDTPKAGGKVQVGSVVPIAGVAWHQHVGVGKVQVQIDGGAWTDARLGSVPSKDTWRQWVLPWKVPSPGMHKITVRAFDADGAAQDTRRQDPYPGAASGLHSVSVHAS